MMSDDSVTAPISSKHLRPSLARRIIVFPLVLMVIAWMVFGAAQALAGILFDMVPRQSGPLNLLYPAIEIGCVVSAYWVFCRFIAREPMRQFGREGWAKELLAGAAGGAALFALAVGIVAAFGGYSITGWGSIETLWRPLAAAIVVGFGEEFLFRGILFEYIERVVGSWIALVLVSILFGAMHLGNPHASLLAAAAIAIEAGILLGALYMLTRRLWAAIGLHMAWNLTQGWVFGLPVSGGQGGMGSASLMNGRLAGPEILTGGSFGLEASLPAMLVSTSAGVAVLILAIRRGRIVRPMWARKIISKPIL